MKERLIEKSKILQNLSTTLYQLIDELSERIIILDLADKLGVIIDSGNNIIVDSDLVKEIRVQGTTFNLINKDKSVYKAYMLHFDREYNVPHLGFMYNKEIISLHIKHEENIIINKYNDIELNEILIMVEERIKAMSEDIEYLKSNADLKGHKFYYRNYDGMFEGVERFSNLESVFEDYEKRVKR
jgi:hypothetical protein